MKRKTIKKLIAKRHKCIKIKLDKGFEPMFYEYKRGTLYTYGLQNIIRRRE
jgi:fructose-bisphosphate aldolase class 1